MNFGDFKAGGWSLLAGWIFPSTIFVFVISASVLSEFPDQYWVLKVLELKFSERFVVLLGVAAALGIVLSACSQTLYRILEGYYFIPPTLARKLAARQSRKRDRLWKKYQEASTSPDKSITAGILLERRNLYPVLSLEVAPTAFANVLRAAETYGWDRYKIDAVAYWAGLLAHCPEPLRVSEERARTSVDFFVASCSLSVLAFITSTIILFMEGPMPTLVFLAVSVIVFLVSYYFAVSAAKSWSSEIKCVVDVGRVGLLKSMGLNKPGSLPDERDQWRALGWLRKYPFQEAENSLKGTSLWPEPVESDVRKEKNVKKLGSKDAR